MPYAVRYMSPTHSGMLVEMDGRALSKIIEKQRADDELREAYWETPEPRHQLTLPPETFPRFERMPAYRAHQWVMNDHPHETLLYVEDGKIRRAG